ncbi:MAG: aminotransferase class I/II-fold pyridoxal phosphate-dependent enzyme [Coriobacteriales bacterium]|nr:aminotransferase class I/II-fold pyridoxal phosphate-dependent enzyme [Coriobacteriales bacterium]
MLRTIVKAYKERTQQAGVSGFDSIPIFVDLMNESLIYPPFTTITSGVNEPECTVEGRKFLLFCANNYLSLTENRRVKKAAIAAIEKYGVGPGGSRVIAGNVDIIEELERRIARLTGTEDCLTLPTGYMANVSVIKAVLDPFFFGMPVKKDSGAVFLDEFNHGSVQDGCEVTTAEKITYAHDDLDDLERKLKECHRPNKLIVTEGVFSLEGEILDLPAYVRVARKHGAKIMIDDAHGVGVIGERGGGIVDYHDCAQDVDILMGCMYKAFGGTGGYLCGTKPVVDYLRVAVRSSILSSAIPTMMAGAMIEAVDIIENGQELRRTLFEKAAYLRNGLVERGFTVLGRDLIPSVPLFMGDEYLGVRFTEELHKRGILCSLVRWPAAPQGKARFRIIVMARHSYEQLDRFLDACSEIGVELGMLEASEKNRV